MSLPYLSLVIPAYDEAQRLPRLLDGLKTLAEALSPGQLLEVIVVCDGCTDETASVARAWAAPEPVRVKVVEYRVNRGKGFALRTGMARSTGALVAFLDADGATQPIELVKLCREVCRDACDVAVGSRRTLDATLVKHQPVHRRVLGAAFAATARAALGLSIQDTQCGAKAMDGPLGRALFSLSRQDGFAIDLELLVLAKAMHLRIREIGVCWTDQPGSNVSVIRDGLGMLAALVHLRWRAWRITHSASGQTVRARAWNHSQ